ncbi:MAG: AAA family ATPase [Streptosporangiaceae bacterium]
MRAVICIGGAIASGKSTLAEALAGHLQNAAVRSFGDVVRKRASEEGKPLDRATLQDVGLSLIGEGWPSFVDALLEDLPEPTDFLVVEGVRHREAVDEIASRQLSEKLLTVYLQVDHPVRSTRQQGRGEPSLASAHPVESSLGEARAAADLIIDGSRPMQDIVSEVVHHLQLCGGGSGWPTKADGHPSRSYRPRPWPGTFPSVARVSSPVGVRAREREIPNRAWQYICAGQRNF